MYGVENPSQAQIIKDRKAETTMEHFGVENPFQAEEIIQTCKDTKWEKYGRLYNPKSFGRYEYKGIVFDSKEEVYFYIYHRDILKDNICRGHDFIYRDSKGEPHTYRCDFLLNGENIEIKGTHLIDVETMILKKAYNNQDEELLLYKTECMNKNNVKIIIAESQEMLDIINIVEKQYPNLVESCKKSKRKIIPKPRIRKSSSTDIYNGKSIFDI